MQIRVLGCSGGIGQDARTTALLVDDDILIDAGTGVGDLPLTALATIDHVFLTHAHLDHTVCVPFLVDTVGSLRTRPLVVHAQQATLDVLKQHIFNWHLWPDFTVIPNAESPYLQFDAMTPGQTLELNGRYLRSIPVDHTVPAVGYLLTSSQGSLAFSGDTGVTEAFWAVLNACKDLRHVLIETSFVDAEEELSLLSKHLSPRQLVQELKKLNHSPEVHITHLMPGAENAIMQEIVAQLTGRTVQALHRGKIFNL